MIVQAAGRRDRIGAKYGMWLFLFTEILFFGGMFLLYSVYRSEYPVEFHASAAEENLLLGSINTAVLLTSSLFIAVAISAVKKGSYRLSIIFQVATILMGLAFLGIKSVEWSEKITRGIYPNSPVLDKMKMGDILFFGLYYVMTGIHGIHVFIGICVISSMVYFTLTGNITKENFSKIENTGLYWHFVDIVWIYLFPLFYLIT
ncbi:MAG: cytochrome c oxidase subunit 3 family protein [Nitrospiraceae bacterium]|nr:cytochrome c oxidase subunit 3 family protein [Nitrospiraceae bacterium]